MPLFFACPLLPVLHQGNHNSSLLIITACPYDGYWYYVPKRHIVKIERGWKIQYCHYTKCCSRQERCLSTQERRFDLRSYPRSDEHALAHLVTKGVIGTSYLQLSERLQYIYSVIFDNSLGVSLVARADAILQRTVIDSRGCASVDGAYG